MSTVLIHIKLKYSRKYTDQKENQILLIYKEIHGAVAKSYMRKGFLIYGEIRKTFNHIWGGRYPLVIYDFATSPFWISLYMRKIRFFYQCIKYHDRIQRKGNIKEDADCFVLSSRLIRGPFFPNLFLLARSGRDTEGRNSRVENRHSATLTVIVEGKREPIYSTYLTLGMAICMHVLPHRKNLSSRPYQLIHIIKVLNFM